MSELRQRPGDQPLPRPSDSPIMHHLVQEDLQARLDLGIQRYGQPLQAHNGRDALRDAYEESLDHIVYLRQAIYERDHPRPERLIDAIRDWGASLEDGHPAKDHIRQGVAQLERAGWLLATS